MVYAPRSPGVCLGVARRGAALAAVYVRRALNKVVRLG